ncbi:MAG TPA: arginine--tRNA ligase [Spirochaetota bacterium]|nr:arginine--tRNA ligase [Spirochaetota bacterium]HPL17464.1 arginine--tRNA ligase [Spirochaetota bacterium]HQJ69566.1 arginine--tRNA ligase [Spirochaetota bacterium]HRS75666.1 arginine--tRNA ligase [Spirochaetota bacterium]HRT73546.1 arginine--tRNA ligase [Spirochaetota bacterium]
MNLKNEIATILAHSIAAAVAEGSFQDDLPGVERKVEYPRDQKFGDYAIPFALESAKLLRKSPMEIGQKLAQYMGSDPRIEKIEVVKPGFINIFLSSGFLFKTMKDIIVQGKEYGRARKENPRRVNIEFVSANPTGPLNIVSARAAAVGDTIANLLEFTGDTVNREFYINDFGNQVLLLGRSVLARIRELRGETVDFPEDGYHGEYIRDIAAQINSQYGEDINEIKEESALIDFVAQKAIEYNVKGQKKDLEKFNVRFQTWFSEKTLHEKDEVMKTLQVLQSRGVVFSEEGKTLFKSTDFDDDKDRVLVRDDGRPTYFLADIAYHNDKMQRGYDLIIDIWGPDHHGHIKRLFGALKAMGLTEDKFKILIAQQVNLLMEGETVKMSKRLGQFSTMRDLIDEIGVDVARYFFVMRSLESHLDFDLTLAKKQSSENPVFYLQYAHARICSLFREADKRGHAYDPELARAEYFDNEESQALMKLLAKFPEEAADAAEKFEPHRITTFLMKVAQGFHKFYTEHRILTEDREMSLAYLTLCGAVRIVMANGLRLLGVSAPEQM